MQGPFPRVRLRADSHMPATQCCAARNPPPISSQRRLGAPAARELEDTPPKFSAARPHCGRAPTHATVPLDAPPPLMTPFSPGEADPESRVAADVHQQKQCPALPPTGPGNERRLRLERNLRRSRPHAPEFHISRRVCDRQRNVCLSAIVPIWVSGPRLDTIADTFGSQNVRKRTNVSPNDSGMVGRSKNANLLRTSAIISGWT